MLVNELEAIEMSPDLRECETEALKLSLKDRAALAERLIASLDVIDNVESERLWIEEAEHRYQEYKKGHIPSHPAEEVLRDARDAIT